ncbi:hypothetical protein V3C10_17145 [[Clostridium] symbiosum]|uniref:hypothetical protein n=1 Tax=Clostridium symbiosum TaxID=1512 RepID=UPI001D07253C|nr:hypothetical protein [[Clostridium] symbiosum]MCB6607484.1 hypothetical protein [[Clostridium] symbiosum]MCB6930770.1 hypothetical protein [[Clostridium] symbiosum]
MKKRKTLIIAILLIICLLIIGKNYYNKYEFVRIVHCQIIEQNDEGVLLKATLGTFDPTEYGMDIYYTASPKVWKKIEELAKNKSVDTTQSIEITFRGNDLIDLRKKKEAVYFRIRNVRDIKPTGIVGLH